MNKPYNEALIRPRAAEPLFFIKNDTVIGTIGNTQGVNNAAKPQRIASKISDQSEPEPAASFVATAAPLPSDTETSVVVGERQLPWLQA